MPQAIVIVGGGAIGSAIAAFLTADPALAGSVTVVERDPSYRLASSARSASSIRQQFSTPINIAMSQFGLAFAREIGLAEHGYLFLASARGVERLRSNHAIQREHGVDAVLLDPAQLRERFPWLSTNDVALGSLGVHGEGWFDGYLLLQYFREQAVSQGAIYLRGDVAGMEIAGERVHSVRLADGSSLPADLVVNAAGPWAAAVGAMLNVDLPVRARRRCVYVFSAPGSLARCPLVIDTSGLYFRPEGDDFLVGISPPEESDPDDLPLEADRATFDEILWPALAERVPLFERVKLRHSWAGYYEYNVFDHNGMVGRHPTLVNAYFANGFSGHGLQHAPAIGRGVTELILHGAYRTLDLSPLAFERVLRHEPLVEVNII
ncbi:FAD-binding oxidoreductase [bacterium]|nr:MAG: FAD-binding oxidoreductase [bacterium]